MLMMKPRFALLVFVFLATAANAANAPLPAPPTLDAKSFIVIDAKSDVVLVEHNPDERLAPASITKVMTAYVVFKALQEGHISLDDEALVSEKAWRMEGSRMFIEVNKRVKVDDLLRGMIVQSGNDASVALAELVAGSEQGFVAMMNAEVEALDLDNTHYVNSTGLPDTEHYTSARDIALLAAALIRDFPDQYPRYSQRDFTFNGIKQYNRNKLLWRDPSVDGLKTGHTDSAGYCLAASAERDGMRLISVVMGTKSAKARATQSQSLLNYAFRFFETHRLYSARETLAESRVWEGETENVPVGLQTDLYVTIPRGQYDALDAKLSMNTNIVAPVSEGQTLGEVIVALDGKELKQHSLVALQAVPRGGLWRQAVDTVLQWFN